MVTKRIIPCLDVFNGSTVKGVNFKELKISGNPVEMGKRYSQQGADELVYLDISATIEGRGSFLKLVKNVAKEVNIPFTVGGGVKWLSDAARLLDSGADKITINSAAVRTPELIGEIATKYGSQFVVAAIDAKIIDKKWIVTINGGRVETNLELFSWATELWRRGAGEILFTSMDHDGTKMGFACDAISQLTKTVPIPVIASGGAGTEGHFYEVFTKGGADAALAASVFHFGEIEIVSLKKYLRDSNIVVRDDF